MAHTYNIKIEFLNKDEKPVTICADSFRFTSKEKILEILVNDGTTVRFPLTNVKQFSGLPPLDC